MDNGFARTFEWQSYTSVVAANSLVCWRRVGHGDAVRAFLGVSVGERLGRVVRSVERLDGGTSKGVYRVVFADGSTAVIYRWHPDEDFWPAQTVLDLGPFGARGGRADFVAKQALFGSLGVRVPRLIALVGDDLAVVEDVGGGTLEALLERDPVAARAVLPRLAAMLRAMHEHTGPAPGTEQVIARRGRRALAEAVTRVPRLAAREDDLAAELGARLAAVTPRDTGRLIHGELGPDHVLIDDAGEPVLIDIEQSMIFDVEWEHAFLELRFGELYPLLAGVELDESRLRLCRLVHYLSLVAGPLMLIDGDFPDRDFMLDIADYNADRALGCLPSG